MSIQEHVILVNDQGMVIGTQEKYAAHTSHTPLHLAFSSWLFNAKGGVSYHPSRIKQKSLGRASGRTQSAAIRNLVKRLIRPLCAAAL
ncbi:isopentenyl-diphosphate delta-isomerase [Enterobacter cloacae]|uniref:Isopentenyl-diphosphate delta-isomerase n=1 Tax=Enterobacter cloacae TaxID=550 RepID=A0A377LTY4_ENTCL|nr:isopentenyl-diphosphate delta-isomerase [Enterobacter cloacae]